MKTSKLYQNRRRWLLALLIAGGLALTTLAYPRLTNTITNTNASLNAPTLAGPLISPGGGGG